MSAQAGDSAPLRRCQLGPTRLGHSIPQWGDLARPAQCATIVLNERSVRGSSVVTTQVMTSSSRVDEPLELARRLHDTVAQRLAGLSYLLSMPERGQADALARCRAEVDAALDE